MTLMEHICTSASSNLDEALNLDAYLANNATRVREFRVNWRLEELQFKEPAGTSRGGDAYSQSLVCGVELYN